MAKFPRLLVAMFLIGGVLLLAPRAPQAARAQASGPSLPAGSAFPFAGTAHYTSGPHGDYTTQTCNKPIPPNTGSGIDFGMGNQSFEVLSVAKGIYNGQGNTEPGPGHWILIEHEGGIQSQYWHLEKYSPEIDHLEAKRQQLLKTGMLTDLNVERNELSIPQGFPLGIAGRSGGQKSIHLHLELSKGGKTRRYQRAVWR